MNAVDTKSPTRIDQLDNGDWLRRLLAEIDATDSQPPSPETVARIRQRVHLTIIRGPSRVEAA